ncbi:hypothetical protein VTJ49DRAFT_1073 [Mycothermus thermophilus]|uniref:SET domain-containing protein n=1 Tax=Humicola insolens TaxID=85995 RepID=A0ABR3VDP8_HUMIN
MLSVCLLTQTVVSINPSPPCLILAPSHLLARPPADLPAVRLSLVSRSVGYGLFAARDFAPGEFILHEAPLIVARYNERFSADADLMRGQAAACRAVLFPRPTASGSASPGNTRSKSPAPYSPSSPTEIAQAMAIAFPALAARLGVAPPDDWDGVVNWVMNPAAAADPAQGLSTANADGVGGLGMNLVPGQGRYAGSLVTRDEYEAYMAPFRGSVAAASAAAGASEGDETTTAAAAAAAAAAAGERRASGPTTTPTSTAPAPVSEKEAREACREFFRHYAFQVPPTARNQSGRGASRQASPNGGTRPSISITGRSIDEAGSGSRASSPSPSSTTGEACIYLLASLINHCCTPDPSSSGHRHLHLHLHGSIHHHNHHRSRSPGRKHRTTTSTDTTHSKDHSTTTNSTASNHNNTHHYKPPPGPNCTWRIGPSGLAHFVRPRHICVQARRAIRAGEQLTWDYGKRDKGFACECETCREGLIGSLGSVCNVI